MANDKPILELKVTDYSDEVLKELANTIPKAMYAAGLTARKNIVNYMSTPDFTGRDIVDTGRLRASISFITEEAESGLGVPLSKHKDNPSKASDRLRGRAGPGEVIIGSNVEYAAYVNSGTTKQPARKFMEHGIQDHAEELKKVVEDVLKGVR